MVRVVVVGVLLLIGFTVAVPAGATSVRDVNVAVRVLDFVNLPPAGHTALGILYDAQNQASAEDARAIFGWLTGESAPRKVPWHPVLIDIRSLAEGTDLGAAIVATGTEPFYDRIDVYARRHHTVTVASGLACVRASRCVVGVVTAPRVEVILNREASAACGVEFSQGFRMMVTEY